MYCTLTPKIPTTPTTHTTNKRKQNKAQRQTAKQPAHCQLTHSVTHFLSQPLQRPAVAESSQRATPSFLRCVRSVGGWQQQPSRNSPSPIHHAIFRRRTTTFRRRVDVVVDVVVRSANCVKCAWCAWCAWCALCCCLASVVSKLM